MSVSDPIAYYFCKNAYMPGVEGCVGVMHSGCFTFDLGGGSVVIPTPSNPALYNVSLVVPDSGGETPGTVDIAYKYVPSLSKNSLVSLATGPCVMCPKKLHMEFNFANQDVESEGSEEPIVMVTCFLRRYTTAGIGVLGTPHRYDMKTVCLTYDSGTRSVDFDIPLQEFIDKNESIIVSFFFSLVNLTAMMKSNSRVICSYDFFTTVSNPPSSSSSS